MATENKKTMNLIKETTNEALRELLREIKLVGNADKPALVKTSDLLKTLFENEKLSFEHYSWLDCYHNVRSSIEREVLHRVSTYLM